MRRGQQGQQVSAARLRKLVSNSEINTSHRDCPRVQDPYTMRCAPQVFGAVRDALEYCTNILNASWERLPIIRLFFQRTATC